MLAEWDAVLCARKDFPADDLQQFIAYARARPGKLNFGSTGYASFSHLIAEVLMHETGISMQQVSYKSGANSLTDLLAGAIDVVFTSSAVAASQAGNKDLKMLAVAAKQRMAMLPNVPTFAERGVAGVDQTSWIGVLGPPGLPSPIRATLSRALVEAVHDPLAQEKMRRIGFEPVGSDAETFEAFYRAEVKRWADFIRERGLRARP
jgi:tripartite-type tricarboxylate transporter receptor subunit TctC